MAVSIKYYTNRFLVIAIWIIIAVWALLFYAFMMDEVYDNVDDGLKNQKIEIIREAFKNPSILEENQNYGINQFRILPTEDREGLDKNHFSREFMYMPYDEEDEPYRVLKTGFYSKDGLPYSLEIRTSTVEEDDYSINLAIALTVLYLLIVLSILVVNYFVMSRAWKPFREILNNLSRYRFGHSKSFEPIPTKVKEFEELNGQIVNMISRNEEVFAGQKRFLENASHELQTPLAITISKLELLMQEGTLDESQLVRVSEAKQSLHRMVALNKSLLMLSRIDNNQYNEMEQVSFNDVLKNLLHDMEDIIEYKGIEVEFREQGNFTTQFNTDLAQIMLSNLIRNAIKYNTSPGKIRIEVTDSTIDIANSSNTGALNPTYIFERFHKGTQDNQSNGLGLSIVQSILEQHKHIKLAYRYEGSLQHFVLKKQD
ncbi:HAMP domain-containing sensor histidine kinase [Sphingobacterium sp. BN32]|uniref:sensor histidine kinase n=1 Tax=Sphingobacterium sp. BN32 TaxID=3058432 RepID=UPI00265CC1B5|nr:HAMP domain-containing sensor histidine kinase [Sphingobacterium sp. BN32]WKK59847.1 HAMP domain-containing sensor histidine kinase [Sphingobacterium sp. BN32]